jgi:hypothetical protein
MRTRMKGGREVTQADWLGVALTSSTVWRLGSHTLVATGSGDSWTVPFAAWEKNTQLLPPEHQADWPKTALDWKLHTNEAPHTFPEHLTDWTSPKTVIDASMRPTSAFHRYWMLEDEMHAEYVMRV